jgi:hypothetical protein
VVDALALPDPPEDGRLLVQMIRRDENRDGLADGLVGGVAEDALGPLVPAHDDAFERLADDGVVGRLDDGREPVGGQLGAPQVDGPVVRGRAVG